MSNADTIFNNVFAAMQDAEEIWGCDGMEYIRLMERISSEAVTRIDNYKCSVGLTVPYLAAIIQNGVLADVRRGTIPRGVPSFSALHDYVDANCYGGLCEAFYELLVEYCGGESEAIGFINAAQTQVDQWIKAGNVVKAIEEEEAVKAPEPAPDAVSLGLLERLRANYPGKVFEQGQRGVVYLIQDDMAIFDPTRSECGRFDRPDLYGLDTADAVTMSEFNAPLWEGAE